MSDCALVGSRIIIFATGIFLFRRQNHTWTVDNCALCSSGQEIDLQLLVLSVCQNLKSTVLAAAQPKASLKNVLYSGSSYRTIQCHVHGCMEHPQSSMVVQYTC